MRDLERKRAYSKAYHKAHKAEKRERDRKWRAAHPGYDREYQRDWYRKNSTRRNAVAKAWRDKQRAADPEGWKRRRRNVELKRAYGITLDEYEEMLKKQRGRCAICGSHDPKSPSKCKPFFVDHDHKTGAVRGLLCFNCNSMLGLGKDSVDTLKKAIAYLLLHKK